MVCFSIGLALTMVSASVVAALSVKHVASRWSGFSGFARHAPYVSGVLIVLVGLYTGWGATRASSAAKSDTRLRRLSGKALNLATRRRVRFAAGAAIQWHHH